MYCCLAANHTLSAELLIVGSPALSRASGPDRAALRQRRTVKQYKPAECRNPSDTCEFHEQRRSFETGNHSQQRGAEHTEVDRLRAEAGGQGLPGMPQTGARHHGERHQSECASGPGVNTNARRDDRRIKNRRPQERKADRHEGVADMQNEHEPIRGRAIASPAGEPNELNDGSHDQGDAGDDAIRQCHPERQ